jgi:hypothetical protein
VTGWYYARESGTRNPESAIRASPRESAIRHLRQPIRASPRESAIRHPRQPIRAPPRESAIRHRSRDPPPPRESAIRHRSRDPPPPRKSRRWLDAARPPARNPPEHDLAARERLGLATVRRLVELHGGILRVQVSGPCPDSIFSVSLPGDRAMIDLRLPASGSPGGFADRLRRSPLRHRTCRAEAKRRRITQRLLVIVRS